MPIDNVGSGLLAADRDGRPGLVLDRVGPHTNASTLRAECDELAVESRSQPGSRARRSSGTQMARRMQPAPISMAPPQRE